MHRRVRFEFPDHFDPRRVADPGWYGSWLALYDPFDDSLPLWNDIGVPEA